MFQCTGGNEVCNLIQVGATNDRWECVPGKCLYLRTLKTHHPD